MELYLPIAEISLSAPLLVLLGTVIGFLSGLFGVGGGFLMTPVLLLMGVPPSVAVASQTGTVVASSASSVITYGRQGLVDYRMALVMAFGGVIGAFLGVELFHLLRQLGQAELVIAVLYLVLLGVVGSMMLW